MKLKINLTENWPIKLNVDATSENEKNDSEGYELIKELKTIKTERRRREGEGGRTDGERRGAGVINEMP